MFDAGDAPQLRTILLTDICDSTRLVEVLGDKGTAQLFREHDRLVLTLQQRWRGRLIDRSDGLLLLFERPIDGLGFAIDYARGLAETGKLRSMDIKVRAGLHVGEVLTWRNSEESVRVGAKPIEVEGLAKPTAARLMSMARPGQILLSAVAEPLAHRAARELGERGQNLIWKSLGRWRFKGVPEPQEIFEVGEPGLAPLRAPPNSPKAWRAVPLWRRPAMLAAQVALVVAVGIGGWLGTRPAPAIAFGERDWVVVGDLRNLTGQSVLDESLEQAFRISLEQSRHVNLLSDLKTRDTLARMQLPADTVIDRDIASEIALRDGARAVILPTVAEVGGRVRFSVEVIDPATQSTVFAEQAEGQGAASALESVDNVVAALRQELGEALQVIEESSSALPQVTTRSLDALRAYAIAQKAYARQDYDTSMRLYERATQIDPRFALAWLGRMRVSFAREEKEDAVAALRKAQVLRDHLAPREIMYMEAWAARFDEPSEASSRWQELARLYPDYFPGLTSAAIWLYEDNRFDEALEIAKSAAQPQNETASINYDVLGRLFLGLEQYSEASSALESAVSLGYSSALRRQVALQAAMRRHHAASVLAESLPKQNPHAYFEQVSLGVDRGQWMTARKAANEALGRFEAQDAYSGRAMLLQLAVAEWMSGESESAAGKVERAAGEAIAALDAGWNPNAEDDVALAIYAALLGQRLGDEDLAKRVLDALRRHAEIVSAPSLTELHEILRAEVLRLRGDTNQAIATLEGSSSENARYQMKVALLSAYSDAGKLDEAVKEARWLQRRRGLAYVELRCGHCVQALNVVDSNLAVLAEAELLARQGNRKAAVAKLAEFDRIWPVEILPAHLSDRRAALANLVSKVGVV